MKSAMACLLLFLVACGKDDAATQPRLPPGTPTDSQIPGLPSGAAAIPDMDYAQRVKLDQINIATKVLHLNAASRGKEVSQEDLRALYAQTNRPEALLDPWGREYQLSRDDEGNFLITSLGPDSARPDDDLVYKVPAPHRR